METQETTARQQFADDYLLVADNDYHTYEELLSKAEEMEVVELSESMRHQYEELVDKILGSMRGKYSGYSEFEKGLMMQLLGGWGSDAFDTIARELKSRED